MEGGEGGAVGFSVSVLGLGLGLMWVVVRVVGEGVGGVWLGGGVGRWGWVCC